MLPVESLTSASPASFFALAESTGEKDGRIPGHGPAFGGDFRASAATDCQRIRKAIGQRRKGEFGCPWPGKLRSQISDLSLRASDLTLRRHDR